MKKLTFLLFFILCCSFVFGQATRAESLQSNVVLIADQGFGFIAGEWNNTLYIVTALHVLQEGDQALNLNAIPTEFHDIPGNYASKIIMRKDDEDIALLEVTKPAGFKWEKECLATYSEEDPLSYVGRLGCIGPDNEWCVAKGTGSIGSLSVIDKNENIMEAALPNVGRGSSGAPLVNGLGIIGMILQSEGSKAFAISIERLQIWISSEKRAYFSLERTTQKMRDGKEWLKKNLTEEIKSGSWWYADNPAYKTKDYGRLYTLEAAKKGCAMMGKGWGVPTIKEWQKLAMQYGGYHLYDPVKDDPQGDSEKAFRTIIPGSEIENEFDAPLAGYRELDGSFVNVGGFGFYWSQTETPPRAKKYIYSICLSAGKLGICSIEPLKGQSVRCIKN